MEQTRRFPARLAEAANVSAFVESATHGLDPRLVMRLRLAVE
jgi:hypothetical protein